MKPHKYADVIKAWADGAQVQWRHPAGGSPIHWLDDASPKWFDTCEYRVKPRVLRYRVGLFGPKQPYVATVDKESSADPGGWDGSKLIRRLGDWQEVEV